MVAIGKPTGPVISKKLMQITERNYKQALKRVRPDMTREAVQTSFDVVNPFLTNRINDQAIVISESTLKTTQTMLDKRFSKVREAIMRGTMDKGNTVDALTEEVQGVFNFAEKFRARRIAVTESSRAVHSAQVFAARDAGFVQGFEFVVSADACELCQVYDKDNKPTGRPLAPYTSMDDAVKQLDQYNDRSLPPIHPNCRCTIVEVFSDEEPPAQSMVKEEQLGTRPSETPRRRPKVTASEKPTPRPKEPLKPKPAPKPEKKPIAVKPKPAPKPEPKPITRKDIDKKMRKEEEKIKTDKVESGILMDKDGKVIVSKAGSQKHVSFTNDELAKFDGSTLTHNHPVLGGNAYASTFSPDDVNLAVGNKLAEIRVVSVNPFTGATSRKSVIIPESIRGNRKIAKELDDRMRKVHKNAKAQTMRRINKEARGKPIDHSKEATARELKDYYTSLDKNINDRHVSLFAEFGLEYKE